MASTLWETDTAITSGTASTSSSNVWYYWSTDTTTGITSTTAVTSGDVYWLWMQRPVVSREYEQEHREAHRKYLAAKEKSLKLLRLFLNAEQWECLEKNGFFTMIGASGARYEIHNDSHIGNVIAVDFKGKKRQALCAHPRKDLPQADVMLAQMLALQCDEEAFLEKANLA